MKDIKLNGTAVFLIIVVVIDIFGVAASISDAQRHKPEKCAVEGCNMETGGFNRLCILHRPVRNYQPEGTGSYYKSNKSKSSSSSSSYSPKKSNSHSSSYSHNMITDPEDYDDPEEYADDADGIDFDSWDDAYDYWEEY